MLGVGASKKTYVDDLFSTYLYEGTATSNATNNATTKTITNGIDLAGEGGMVWIKGRTTSHGQEIFDTHRGILKDIRADRNNGEETLASSLTAFNSNGFGVGDRLSVNENDDDHVSWTFRKAKGFFDVVTYTGTGSARTVAHNLGSVPGCIMVKRTDAADNWVVYHRGMSDQLGNNPGHYYLYLDDTNPSMGGSSRFNNTAATSTEFSVGTDGGLNDNGGTYVAYVFAGGESTAATARSVDFDGSGDYLDIPNSSDFSFGSGNFTVEGWFKLNALDSAQSIIGVWDYANNQRSWNVEVTSANKLVFSVSADGTNGQDALGGTLINKGVWTHFAAVRDGNTLKSFINGTQVTTSSFTGSLYDNTNDKLYIGMLNGAANITNGQISNIRVVKGTAVYTSSFRPPTSPLTNITNTKLLCCNNSSTTGSTVTPGTITANGDPTASSNSPFDDPTGFKFGVAGNQNVIKCGSYVGNGSTTGPEINLGFEPQWILLKNASSASGWRLFDSMRGIATGGNAQLLYPNGTDAESSTSQKIDLTSTGFRLTSTSEYTNENGSNFIYMALRRSDGYVGKPIELGTDVFAMDTGNSSSTIPAFDSGFPVDFAFNRRPASTESYYTSARLIQGKYLHIDTTAVEASDPGAVYDSNLGYYTTANSDYQGWMFKRHAGFDVVTYKGTGVQPTSHPHNLSKTPEMIWTKNRDNAQDWVVWHKNFGSGGSNVNNQYAILNTNAAETGNNNVYGGSSATAPTATHWTTGEHEKINDSSYNYIAMLFASVDGVSKVGSYTGTGSTQTITTGFQPRFLMFKNIGVQRWFVVDTTRGWGSGDDKYIAFDDNMAQVTYDFGAPTSTGFTLTPSGSSSNASGSVYIYYAHA